MLVILRIKVAKNKKNIINLTKSHLTDITLKKWRDWSVFGDELVVITIIRK